MARALQEEPLDGCHWRQPQLQRNDIMNWDQIAGEWLKVKGTLRTKWAKLTDDDLEAIAGRKDVLVGKLQQRYGLKKEEVERDVDSYLKDL
jgi:uncharacterized protein YjbJ (UPF0337 family)